MATMLELCFSAGINQTPRGHKFITNREQKRNCGQQKYCPNQAHRKPANRQRWILGKIQSQTWTWIQKKVREYWTPEQIPL